MATTLVGCVIALLNMLILFELNRMNNAIVAISTKYDDKIDGEHGLSPRLVKLEAEVASCPTCRKAKGL